MTDPLVVVHTSDIHLGSGADHGLPALQSVLLAARHDKAHVLLLAGDIFDNNRVDRAFVRDVAALLGDAGLPVVILPGNHDCLTPDAVYREACFAALPNVHILGLTAGEAVVFEELRLEVWGRAHLDYEDMAPLASPPPRSDRRWHIGMAHGHFVRDQYDEGRSYLIRRDHLEQVRFDYLALGHWDVWTPLETSAGPAYYSGSPHLARSVNLVHLDEVRGVQVARRRLTG
jgi:DNA repair exonuclease SbcCD nuclease subunit